MTKGNYKHGLKHTPTYRTWGYMRERCKKKNHPSYPRYGGAGVTVCGEWDKSFLSFIRDMGMKPPHMSLDRIDNAKGYSKDNCRWATPAQQSQNRGPFKSNCKKASKYKGVYKTRQGNWQVKIFCNKKQIVIGTFEDELEAAHAYNVAAKKHHGEFACLNQI